MNHIELEARSPDVLVEIKGLLARGIDYEEKQVGLIEEQNELARRRTDTTSNLLQFSSATAKHTEDQTAMALERTSLTRVQTKLSTRSTELAHIRTDLARESTAMAEQRTELALNRTELARQRTKLADTRTALARSRTELAEQRNTLSQRRTDLAQQRNDLAGNRTIRALTRTRLSLQRTELARGRTFLAMIRTGLAFLAIGLTLFRYFGISRWSAFDGALVLLSVILVVYGTKGYRRSHLTDRRIGNLLAQDPGLAQVM